MEFKILLIQAIQLFTNIFIYAIVIRAIMSWFVRYDNPVTRFLDAFTEPVVEPIRKLLNNSPLSGPGMVVDFSPVIALFAVQIIERVLIRLILLL